MPWNQPKTVEALTLLEAPPPEPPPPATAAPKADTPVKTTAAPATPTATYDMAATLTVLPFDTCDWMQATSAPPSRAFSSRVASAAISGI